MHRWIVICLMAGGIATAQTLPEMPARSLTTTLDAMPLYTARQQVLEARARFFERDYAGMVEPLNIAALALAAYEKQDRGPNAMAADAMRQEIENYTRVVANDHSEAYSRLEDWLARIQALCSYCLYPTGS